MEDLDYDLIYLDRLLRLYEVALLDKESQSMVNLAADKIQDRVKEIEDKLIEQQKTKEKKDEGRSGKTKVS